MYFYLYDSFLQDKKYERTVALIEARVADLGIKGRAMKLSVLQQLEESIHEAVDRGARTVVAVGNDKTINEAVSVVANYANVTLGIIPVGEGNEIAKTLGIPLETAACDVISNRLIDIVDIGRVNGRFFLGKLEIENGGIILECDEIYKIMLGTDTGRVMICNFGEYFGHVVNPKDEKLEILVLPKEKTSQGFFSFFRKNKPKLDSVLTNKKIKIISRLRDEKDGGTKNKPIKIDGDRVIKTPAIIDVAPGRLKVIVGKERRV